MPSTASALLACCALWAVATAQTSGGSDGRKMQEGCVMTDEERRDSWDNVFMLNAYECESRGFCWAVHEIPGVPWCYWKEGEGLVTEDMCSATSSSRTECAIPGKPINEKTCKAKACCWRSGESGQPWCYNPGPSDATPRPKRAEQPAKPAEPTPPLTTPKFIRPTPPPMGWKPEQRSMDL